MVSIVLGALLLVQAPPPDPPAPSAIEHALVEYRCRAKVPVLLPGTDPYRACYSDELASLRESFGRDLGRLSAADRRTLDAACGQVQETRGRDAYLACLDAQLVAVRNRRGRGAPAAPGAPSVSDPNPPADTAGLASEVAVLPETTSSSTWWIAAIAAMAAVAGGAAFLALRTRRSRVTCRSCGADVAGSGDLCPACRHQAAETLRRAAADRAQAEQADQAEQQKARRHVEQEQEEFRREQARREEAERLRQQEEERLRLARDQKAEEARRRSEAAEGAGEVFDPYAVLAVARDAMPDAIQAAYEQMKAKYDESEFGHLGLELQQHFKAKAQAVERAYIMLRPAD
jgi:hypothetical protein